MTKCHYSRIVHIKWYHFIIIYSFYIIPTLNFLLWNTKFFCWELLSIQWKWMAIYSSMFIINTKINDIVQGPMTFTSDYNWNWNYNWVIELGMLFRVVCSHSTVLWQPFCLPLKCVHTADIFIFFSLFTLCVCNRCWHSQNLSLEMR